MAVCPYCEDPGDCLCDAHEEQVRAGDQRVIGALATALQELWAEVHADHGDINSPKWVRMEACEESACVRARAALALAEERE